MKQGAWQLGMELKLKVNAAQGWIKLREILIYAYYIALSCVQKDGRRIFIFCGDLSLASLNSWQVAASCFKESGKEDENHQMHYGESETICQSILEAGS